MSLKLRYRERGETVEILRCYGERRVVSLPEFISGKRVTALGDYLFSEDMRQEPEGLLWECDKETGRAVQMPAGETVDRNGRGEVISEEASGTGPVICGASVEEVRLPAGLQSIGKYAFYNCDKLKRLHLSSTISEIGAGAFNGCRKITVLDITVVRGEKSCLKEVLSELNETLTVYYRQAERAADGTIVMTGEARLLFPLFYEEAVENTPARMLETHVHGCGHRYRYCFEGTEFKFREYDALFIHAKAQEPPARVAELAIGRLRYPLGLSDEAYLQYGNYLLKHMENTAAYLAESHEMKELKWFVEEFSPEKAESADRAKRVKNEHAAAGCLGNEGLAVRAREELINIEKPILGKTGFDKLIEAFSHSGCVEALSYVMDAAHRGTPSKKKKFIL